MQSPIGQKEQGNSFDKVEAKAVSPIMSDADGEKDEYTKSEDSQDLRNFERKVKKEITLHQLKQYEKRCDKSLMKMSFLKGSQTNKNNTLKNL